MGIGGFSCRLASYESLDFKVILRLMSCRAFAMWQRFLLGVQCSRRKPTGVPLHRQRAPSRSVNVTSRRPAVWDRALEPSAQAMSIWAELNKSGSLIKNKYALIYRASLRTTQRLCVEFQEAEDQLAITRLLAVMCSLCKCKNLLNHKDTWGTTFVFFLMWRSTSSMFWYCLASKLKRVNTHRQ